MCLLFFPLHFHIGICVSCSSLTFLYRDMYFCELRLAIHYILGLWFSFFFFLPFFFLRVHGFLIFCSSLLQVHGFPVLPFTFLYRVMCFLSFPSRFYIGLCVSCSSLLIFIKGYLFPVLPFTFSYRVMCFLFFLLYFQIGICVSCFSLYIFIWRYMFPVLPFTLHLGICISCFSFYIFI